MSKQPSGKKHTCSICGKQAIWGEGWRWYDAAPTPIKVCSDACDSKFIRSGGDTPYWPEVSND